MIVIGVYFDKYSSRSINLYMYIQVFGLSEWYLNLYNIIEKSFRSYSWLWNVSQQWKLCSFTLMYA